MTTSAGAEESPRGPPGMAGKKLQLTQRDSRPRRRRPHSRAEAGRLRVARAPLSFHRPCSSCAAAPAPSIAPETCPVSTGRPQPCRDSGGLAVEVSPEAPAEGGIRARDLQ